jgi:hypothetical protein
MGRRGDAQHLRYGPLLGVGCGTASRRDGWLPSAYNVTPAQFALSWSGLQELLDQFGRNPQVSETRWRPCGSTSTIAERKTC